MKIPDKEFFTLDEASSISGIRPYIINFWLKEFDMFESRLESEKVSFTGRDIENLLSLKSMMFKDKVSIESAKKRLNSNITDPVMEAEIEEKDAPKLIELQIVKDKLKDLLDFTESLKKSHNWS